MHCRILVLVLVSAVATAGCSSKTTAPVHGKVTLADGTLVKGATVAFQNQVIHTSASGVTGDDGKYSLTTLKPGDGAPPGTYKVTVHHPTPKDSSQPQVKGLFHPKYESPETSKLEYTVKKGDNPFDIVLQKP